MSRSDNFERFAATDAVSGDLKRKSVLGALATGAGGAFDFVLRLGSTLILARLLVPEHFGLVAMVTAITRIAERFATLGLSTATVQAPDITDGQCSNLFWINVAAGGLFAGLLVAFSPAIASFYSDPRLQPIAIALSLNFLLTGLTVQHEALLRRQMKLPQVAINRLVATLLSVTLAVALAATDFGYWALVWKEVAQLFFVAVGVWILCPWLPRLPSRRVDMGRLLSFGRDMTATQLLLAVAAQLDTLLIGRFAGASVLGLYRQAYNLMMGPVERLRNPIYGVSQPGLSILQRQPDRYRRYYQRILFVVSFATVPLGVFTIVYAPEIILVALGEKWVGATIFLRIFGVVAAIQPALGTTGTVMITRGRSGRFLIVSLVNNALLALLMFVGVPWGAVGIAGARAATLVLMTPWTLRYSLFESPVSPADFLRTVAKPAAASGIMAAALLALQRFGGIENVFLSLGAACGLAPVAYLVGMLLLPGGKEQVQSLTSELVSALRRRSAVGGTPTNDVT